MHPSPLPFADIADSDGGAGSAVLIYNDSRMAHLAVNSWRERADLTGQPGISRMRTVHLDSLPAERSSPVGGDESSSHATWMVLCLKPETRLSEEQMSWIRDCVSASEDGEQTLVCLHQSGDGWKSSPVRAFCESLVSSTCVNLVENQIQHQTAAGPSSIHGPGEES